MNTEVTIADVTKELIEGVVDPAQDVAKDVELIGVGRWLVPGRISIREWMEMFSDKDALEHAKRVNTLGGLIMVMLDRVPEVGDEVVVGDLKLSVAQMEDRSIQRVVVEIMNQDADDGQSSSALEGGDN
jgi:CBS domain containing-hemolysin-like protein